MSRCYPYPPPGYERRANVELGISPKKEKHKHKDKKKKRRKDSEPNGDLPRDLDKRSRKAQETGVFKDSSFANGSLPETKGTSSEAAHEKVAQRVQAQTSNADMPSAGVLAINCKGIQTNGKQGSQLSLLSAKAVCTANGAVLSEAAPSSQSIPCMEKGWSTLDDQEWLFHQNNLLQSLPRVKLDENPSPRVWAEAVFLPSVGIYALPYVVPD